MAPNHRTVTKPKDVKFKRINKAKSRSLEELRGKLKYPSGSSSSFGADQDDLDELETDDNDDGSANGTPNASQRGSRLALLREIMKNQKSLSLDRESTDPDISTN